MTKNEKEIFDETLKAIKDERDRLREALDVLAEEYAAKLKVSAASVKESAFEIAAERKALQEE